MCIEQTNLKIAVRNADNGDMNKYIQLNTVQYI